MIPAIADTKEALSLSVYYETTKRLLSDAVSERSGQLLARANIKLQQDDRYDALPIDKQRELMILFGQAMKVVHGWGAP